MLKNGIVTELILNEIYAAIKLQKKNMEDSPQHSKLILPLKPSLVPRKAQYQSTIFTPATFISNQYKVALNKNLVIY